MLVHKILGFLERMILSGIMSVIVFVADRQLRGMQARTLKESSETKSPEQVHSARMSRVQGGSGDPDPGRSPEQRETTD